MIREIVEDKNILKRKAQNVQIDEKALAVAQDLCDTLRYLWSSGRICLSLSANQIASQANIMAIADKLGGEIQVMFNPSIFCRRDTQDFWEDNADRPGLMFKTEKAYEIGVRFNVKNGQEWSPHYYGQKACLIQQEVSNLEGVLPEERSSTFAEVGIKKPDSKFLEVH